MEPASKLIAQLPIPAGTVTPEDLVCAAWSKAVGKRIAARTRAARMVRTRLIIEVEDGTWQRQLFSLSGQILRNLAKHLPAGLVDDLEFRVAPFRKGPQVARASVPVDEADGIADPVLRQIYRGAKKKARA